MQSCALMVLRVLVMLACLIAVPMAAIVGTGSWGRVEERLNCLKGELLERCRQALAVDHRPAAPAHPAFPQIDMPPGGAGPTPLAALPGESFPGSPPAAIAPLGNSAVPPSSPMSPATTIGPEQAVHQVAAASSEPPISAAAPTPPLPPFWTTAPSGSPPAGDLAETSENRIVDPQTRPASYAAEPAQSPATPQRDHVPDRVAWIQHRLQTLGADWYRLETAGSRGGFRFVCKTTSPLNPHYVRYFEAVASQPVDAMQQVLDQVDAWFARRPATVR